MSNDQLREPVRVQDTAVWKALQAEAQRRVAEQQAAQAVKRRSTG
jgi:hypothetical protein